MKSIQVQKQKFSETDFEYFVLDFWFDLDFSTKNQHFTFNRGGLNQFDWVSRTTYGITNFEDHWFPLIYN